MKKIIFFIKNNIWITAFFVFSMFIIISYILTTDFPELFNGAEELYNLFFQLSIGYTINFMFYITQIYIPNSKRESAVKICISKRISELENTMYDFLVTLVEIHSSIQSRKAKAFSDEELHQLVKLSFSDKVNKIKVSTSSTGNDIYYTVKDWIKECIYNVDDDIDCLFKYYAAYISADLMEVLEEIHRSLFHTTMRTLLENQNDTRLNQFAYRCGAQYDQLIQKLQEIHKKDYFETIKSIQSTPFAVQASNKTPQNG